MWALMDLYFYTHLESDLARRRVMGLLDGKLVLLNPAKFNDPFDSKLNLRHNDTEQALEKNTDPRLEDVFKNYRMFCFSEVWNSLLMWAHYARSHKGICVKLSVDSSALPRENDVLESVRYTTHYPEILRRDIKVGDDVALKTLLLTKSIDWFYEKEWRYIISHFACKRMPDGKSDYVDVSSWMKVKEVSLGVSFMDFTMQNNTLRSAYGRHSFETIFDVLEMGGGETLRELSTTSALKSAVGRERVLMKFREKNISMLKCDKTPHTFGLERTAFEYNAHTSLKSACLEVVKKESE